MARGEAAAPVETVDAMAAGLLEMLGAHEVSFLVADFSGQTLSHLGHTNAPGGRSLETSEQVDLEGTPQGEALARQEAVLRQEAPRLACWRR
jgi:hypothetical protein